MTRTGTERRKPRWRRRKEARPEEIASAALELFVEQGFAATRMEDVARRAGVTKGTVYLYFDSKEALLRQVVHQSVVPLLEYAEEQLEACEGGSRRLFAEMTRGWWHQMREASIAGIPKLIMAEAGNFPELARFYVEEVLERGRAIYARILERGIERGEFRPVDVGHALRAAMAPIHYASVYTHSLLPYDDDGFDVEGYIETHIEVFLRGLEPDAAASGAAATHPRESGAAAPGSPGGPSSDRTRGARHERQN